MENKKIFVEIHALQNLGVNCINRDDTGAPKMVKYGGVDRMRVSSQAWKHAMRTYMKDELMDNIGIRTRDISGLIKEQLEKRENDIKWDEKKINSQIKKVIKEMGFEKLDGKTVVPVSKEQIHAIADLMVNEITDIEKYKTALIENPPLDVCLFGRMVVTKIKKGPIDYAHVDASSQIAHAFTTNAVIPETDFFTATDDIREDVGAGHLGSRDFTTGVLYRYGNVAVHALRDSYNGNVGTVSKAVRDFVEAFIKAMPTGMQNSYANRNLPYLVYVDIRNDIPISMADAFESPVKSETDKGYRNQSIEKLKIYMDELYSTMAKKPIIAYSAGHGLEEYSENYHLEQLLELVEDKVKNILMEK